jgi:hypothetical protein
LTRAGVGGVDCSSEVGEMERMEEVEREGVDGYEETRVTVAVSALVCRVWVAVREPAVEGREVLGGACASWHW